MKYSFYITILVLFIIFINGCGLLNSDKNKEQPLYQWEELTRFKSEWITAIATSGDNDLYVAQSNLLSYSNDSGNNFIRRFAPDSADIKKIKIYDRLFIIGNVHRQSGGFFGSTVSYVYVSDDNGISWNEIIGGFIMQDIVVFDGKLHIGRKHGVTTYDLQADSVLYTNSFINSNLSDHIEEITVSEEGNIYLASHDGVHESIDEGRSWEKISRSISKNDDFIKSITVDDSETIYAAEYRYLYVKEKNAVTWTRKNIETGTERVRLLRKGNIITADWNGVFFSTRTDLKFQNIGPNYKETENDILSFEYLEVFSDDKIAVADFDHIFIGTPIQN